MSVAVLRGERLVAERRAASGPAAETLLPAIDALFGSIDIALSEIDAFAVSIGPGSFTSLRVGAATAKGLAFGSERPIAAVSTLEALALRVPATAGLVVPLLDARRGEVYAAAYAGDPGRERVLSEGVYRPTELCARLRPPLVLIGDGIAIAGPELRERFGDVTELGSPAGDASAACVGRLGARLVAAGCALAAEQLVPRYLRRAEAEVRRTGRRFEST